MDKKEKLIIKLRKENKQLKRYLKESERWEDYWREKHLDSFYENEKLERSCLYWKCLFFSSLVGSLLVILLSVL